MATELNKKASLKASPKTARAQRTRDRVLEVAMLEFATKTYDEVQAGEIAEKAGVAHGIVFHYFKNKRGLYLEVVQAMAKVFFKVDVPEVEEAPYYHVRTQFTVVLKRMAENRGMFLGYARHSGAMGVDPADELAANKFEVGFANWFCEVCGLSDHLELIIRYIRIQRPAFNKLFADWILDDCKQDIASVVEATMHMAVGMLRAAQCYDPSVNVDHAVRVLLEKPAD